MSAPTNSLAYRLRGVGRMYGSGEAAVMAADGIDLEIAVGDFVAITGASGGGKSTLLNLLGLLDKPSTGSIELGGVATEKLSASERAELRRRHLGFVFQQYRLLAGARLEDNVALPAVYGDLPTRSARRRALELLETLGLGDRIRQPSSELSGGQQQRAAIARAIFNHPLVLLADEPTGALDRASADAVLREFDRLHARGVTVVIVTHDPEVAARAARTIVMREGKVRDDVRHRPVPSTTEARDASMAGRRARPAGLLTRLAHAAVASLWRHRVRSGLSVLGVAIGIFAVSMTTALGRQAEEDVTNKLRGLLSHRLDVSVDGSRLPSGGSPRAIDWIDMERLGALPGVRRVVPQYQQVVSATAGPQTFKAMAVAIVPGGLWAQGQRLVAGREPGPGDEGEPVLVVNVAAARAGALGVGELVTLSGVPFRVVGISRHDETLAGSGDSRPTAYVSVASYTSRFAGSVAPPVVSVYLRDDVDMTSTTNRILALMEASHGQPDIEVVNGDEALAGTDDFLSGISRMLLGIAVVSLVAGAIGIMNMMFVSVQERVGEIGLRMAVGARPVDILVHHTLEAVCLCTLGAIISTAAIAITLGAAPLFDVGLHASWSWRIPLSAMAAALCVGLASGLAPAVAAARIQPARALSVLT